MTKEEYFLKSMKAECFKHKAWVLRAFSITRLKTEEEYTTPTYPYELFTDGKFYCFKDPDTGNTVRIEGGNTKEPLFKLLSGIDVKKADIPSLEKDMRVSYGTLLFNYVSLISTVGSKIPFQAGLCNVKKIEKLIIQKLVDDVDDPSQEQPDKIYVRELLKYVQHTVEISGYSQLCVPSATRRTLQPAPGYRELKTRLLLEHKDELHDPTVIAKIGDELEKLDREWIAGDPDKGFYQKDKSFQIIRKKMFYMFGVEKNFSDDGFTFIPDSLEDGWDVSKFPQLNNSTRDGSHSRGAMTALGGEKTKTIFRVLSGSTVAKEDCGSKMGIVRFFSKVDVPDIVGRTILMGGQAVKVDENNANSFIGKVGMLRDPGYCQAGGNDYCAVCMGDFVRGKEASIPTAGAGVGSVLMLLMMKKMHGKALKTTRYELSEMLC